MTTTRPVSARLTPAAPAGDLVRRDHPLLGSVWANAGRTGGTPCLAGTRVPLQHLFDYLEAGHTIDDVLADVDGVSREQVIGVLEAARSGSLGGLGRP